MMKIETRLNPVEVEGIAITGLPQDSDQVTISAHWNYNHVVIISFRGKTVTVCANELQRAIQNATNH